MNGAENTRKAEEPAKLKEAQAKDMPAQASQDQQLDDETKQRIAQEAKEKAMKETLARGEVWIEEVDDEPEIRDEIINEDEEAELLAQEQEAQRQAEQDAAAIRKANANAARKILAEQKEAKKAKEEALKIENKNFLFKVALGVIACFIITSCAMPFIAGMLMKGGLAVFAGSQTANMVGLSLAIGFAMTMGLTVFGYLTYLLISAIARKLTEEDHEAEDLFEITSELKLRCAIVAQTITGQAYVYHLSFIGKDIEPKSAEMIAYRHFQVKALEAVCDLGSGEERDKEKAKYIEQAKRFVA